MAAPSSKFLSVKSYKYSDQHTAEVLPAYRIAKDGLSFNPTYRGKPNEFQAIYSPIPFLFIEKECQTMSMARKYNAEPAELDVLSKETLKSDDGVRHAPQNRYRGGSKTMRNLSSAIAMKTLVSARRY